MRPLPPLAHMHSGSPGPLRPPCYSHPLPLPCAIPLFTGALLQAHRPPSRLIRLLPYSSLRTTVSDSPLRGRQRAYWT
jgi:hypothetical protein